MFWLSLNAITLFFNILIKPLSHSVSCSFKLSLAPRSWILAALALPELGMKRSWIPFLYPSNPSPLYVSVLTLAFIPHMDHWRWCPFHLWGPFLAKCQMLPSWGVQEAQPTDRSYNPCKMTVVSVFLMQGWAESQVSAPALSCDPRHKLRR